ILIFIVENGSWSVLDTLISILEGNDHNGRYSAARIGQHTLESLIHALKSRDWYVYRNVVKLLRKLVQSGLEFVLNSLIIDLKNKDCNTRVNALISLIVLGKEAVTTNVLEVLTTSLKDIENRICKSVTRTLREFREIEATEDVLKALTVIILDNDIQREAINVLRLTEPSNAIQNAINYLVFALTDKDSKVCANAEMILDFMGWDAVVEHILHYLVILSDDIRVCRKVIEIFDKNVVDQLSFKLKVNISFRENFLGVLSSMGSVTESVLNKLTIALNDKNANAKKALNCLHGEIVFKKSEIWNTEAKDDIWKCHEIITLSRIANTYYENIKMKTSYTKYASDKNEEKKVELQELLSCEEKVMEIESDEYNLSPTNYVEESPNRCLEDTLFNNDEKKIDNRTMEEEYTKMIEENPTLKEYHDTVIATLNNVFSNACAINVL
ncbi:PBS lyase HEAT domain protein repeat-containing protein, partial [Reticulomyxa filosa]